VFGSLLAFDLHRVGSHEHLWSPQHPGGRRCLSVADMLERGFWRGKQGRWSVSRHPDAQAGARPNRVASATTAT
jgi:hypothetical protein